MFSINNNNINTTEQTEPLIDLMNNNNDVEAVPVKVTVTPLSSAHIPCYIPSVNTGAGGGPGNGADAAAAGCNTVEEHQRENEEAEARLEASDTFSKEQTAMASQMVTLLVIMGKLNYDVSFYLASLGEAFLLIALTLNIFGNACCLKNEEAREVSYFNSKLVGSYFWLLASALVMVVAAFENSAQLK